jgi:hypothetical protein
MIGRTRSVVALAKIWPDLPDFTRSGKRTRVKTRGQRQYGCRGANDQARRAYVSIELDRPGGGVAALMLSVNLLVALEKNGTPTINSPIS